MRGLSWYLLAAVLVVLALDFVAPLVGLSSVFGNRPTIDAGSSMTTQYPMPAQYVDRTNKGDRLTLPKTLGKQQTPTASPAAVVGCEPTFSPLSARGTMAGRCIT